MLNLLPETFPSRAALIHRISLDPIACLTPPRAWAPLTDAEWDHVAPYLAALDCGLSLTRRAGRPPVDTRARLDAIFRAVTLRHPRGGRATWGQLDPDHGKPDTVSRTYRRWLRNNLWARLLAEVACPTCPPVLKSLTHWVCCAFRRGIRLMGLRAIVLARRLRLFSALPAPAVLLPDPDLSEHLMAAEANILSHLRANPGWRPRRLIRAMIGLHRFVAGRRPARWMEPA